MSKHVSRVPASPAVLKKLILETLGSGAALKRSEIITNLRELAPLRDFTYQGSGSVAATKKALSQLLQAELIITPRTGWYALPKRPVILTTDASINEETLLPQDLRPTEPPAPKIKIEREIGEGPECVYVYFHDAYFDLAQVKAKSRWECKVGWTVGEPDFRIIGQGALTCFPRRPVIGLAIRTHDGKNLERLLHAALSYAGVRINNGAGAEWFLTSPILVERWFVQFEESLKTLRN